MKNQMRKMMAMLLVVIMLTSSVPFTVFAEEPTVPAAEASAEPEKKPEAPAERPAEEPAKTEEKSAEQPPVDKQKEEPADEKKSKEEQAVEQSSETQKTEQENTTPEETQAADPTEVPDPEGTKEPDAEPTSEPTTAPSAEATQEATAEPTVEASVEPSVTPSAEPTIEPTTEPSVESTIEPTTESTVESTPEVTVSATPEASATPEITVTPEVTPEATPVPTIKFTAPEDGDIVPGQEDLKVEWEIEGKAEGLLFSARDLQRDLKEEDSFIYQEPVSGNKYEISGSDLPYDTDFELWIGITDASGNIVSEDKIEICTDSEPVIEEPENTEEPEDTEESYEENTIEEDEMPVIEDIPLLAKSFSLKAAVPTGTLGAPVVRIAELGADGVFPSNTDMTVSWTAVENAEEYLVEMEYPIDYTYSKTTKVFGC